MPGGDRFNQYCVSSCDNVTDIHLLGYVIVPHCRFKGSMVFLYLIQIFRCAVWILLYDARMCTVFISILHNTHSWPLTSTTITYKPVWNVLCDVRTVSIYHFALPLYFQSLLHQSVFFSSRAMPLPCCSFTLTVRSFTLLSLALWIWRTKKNN